MKNQKKISLILIGIAIVLFILIIFTKKSNIEEPNVAKNTTINTSEENTKTNTINNTTSENTIDYIEMTEEKYKEYNNNKYQFKITGMLQNNDNTITIKGRVYQEEELPTVTSKQYKDLQNKIKINILGHEMIVNEDEKDEDGKYAGHDLLINATDDSSLKFYLDKNSDETGTLSYYSEAGFYKGTNIYMQITVSDTTSVKFNNKEITLKEYIKEFYEKIELSDEEMLNALNDEFVFESGKCISINFSNV